MNNKVIQILTDYHKEYIKNHYNSFKLDGSDGRSDFIKKYLNLIKSALLDSTFKFKEILIKCIESYPSSSIIDIISNVEYEHNEGYSKALFSKMTIEGYEFTENDNKNINLVIESVEVSVYDEDQIMESSNYYYNKQKFKSECYYWYIQFDWKIKEVFYSGDAMLSYNKGETSDEEFVKIALDNCMDTDPNNFFPTLSKLISDFIGDGNFIYDYYDMGKEDFSLYWFIKKDVYPDFIKKLKGWINYLEITDIVKIKDVENEANKYPNIVF